VKVLLFAAPKQTKTCQKVLAISNSLGSFVIERKHLKPEASKLYGVEKLILSAAASETL
jgi:hypothetical protein